MDDVKMDGKSLDITKQNIKTLGELFPEVVEEGKVDFDKLKEILGETVDESDEKYNFTWHGKNEALRISQTPSMGTLRPYKEKSKDWDTTSNVYIEGDNLETLKLLQKSYFGKIKMIYIDPPYNTGNDFVYKDDFKDNITNYLKIIGQIDDKGQSLSPNDQSDGRFHTNWLYMMYPRLRLARNLLTDDGVLCISIDDNEVKNLLAICYEIFGEDNCQCLVWQKVSDDSGKMKITYRVRTEHEYVVLCYKHINNVFFSKYVEKRNYKNEYTNPDNDPRGPYKQAIISDTEDKSNPNSTYYYPVTSPTGFVTTRTWRVEKWEMEELIADNRIYFGKDGKSIPALKAFINEPKLATPSSILSNLGTAKTAGTEIEKLLGNRGIFSYPKPVDLIKHLIRIVTSKQYSLDPSKKEKRKVYYPGIKNETTEISEDTILDFFSGSSTTAQAVMELNYEDGGNRHFILVQLPELLPADSMASKAGYRNLCDVGIDRINKVSNTFKSKIDCHIDLGFRVFKVDTSNIKIWSGLSTDLQKTLSSYVDNLKTDEGRTDEDIVYEILLKLGLDLTTRIEPDNSNDPDFYVAGYGALMICLKNVESTSIVEKMIEWYKKEKPEIWKVVFRDGGFSSDSIKANVRETLKSAGLKEDSFITL